MIGRTNNRSRFRAMPHLWTYTLLPWNIYESVVSKLLELNRSLLGLVYRETVSSFIKGRVRATGTVFR